MMEVVTMPITELSVGGIFVILVLREVFNFVKRRSNGQNGRPPVLADHDQVNWRAVEDQIGQLHEWHSREDEDGVKIWYVRKSLEDAIRALTKNIGEQTNIMQAFADELREMRREIKKGS